MAKIKRFRSLYAYLLVCMLCVLLPVQLVGGWMLLDSAYDVRNNAIQKSEQALLGAAEAVRSQIDMAFQRAQNYLVDSTSSSRQVFRHEVLDGSGKRWIHLRNIMNELIWISRYNGLVLESRLYYPTLGFSISNKSYLSSEKVDWQAVMSDAFTLLKHEDDQLLVHVSYPIYATAASDILILHQISLSLPGLRDLAESKVFAGSCLLYLNGEYVAGSEEMQQYFASSMPAHNRRISLSGQLFHTFVYTDPVYGFAVVNLVPASVLDASSTWLFVLLIIYALLTVVLIVVYIFFLSRSVHKPIRRLLRGFEQMRVGALNVRVPVSGPGEFTQLTAGFNQMAENLNQAIQTVYEQRIYTQQIEFKQLQAQINPHFLYNTFFMLERLVDDEDIEASRATCRYLGEYFRYITYTDAQQTELKNEFAHAMNYLKLQKLRYEERLMIDADELPETIADCLVPRLIFQPILENAFIHGFDRRDTSMKVRVRIVLEEGNIRFAFENSASHVSQHVLQMDLDSRVPDKETTGMMNIHRRIRLLYGEPYGLSLSQSELGGLNVVLLVPTRRK